GLVATDSTEPPVTDVPGLRRAYRSALASAGPSNARKIVEWVRSGRGTYVSASPGRFAARMCDARCDEPALMSSAELARYSVRGAESSEDNIFDAESPSAPAFHHRLGSKAT